MTAQPGAEAPLPSQSAGSGAAKLVISSLIGALVALTLGIYGHLHNPTGIAVNVAGFSGPLTAKTWLATGATVAAVIQVISALIMYGKIKIQAPSWIGGLHRWSGRIAFLLGYQTYSTRVLIHSLLGCLFFGIFTVKMLVLPKKDMPGWLLPTLGGLAFAALTGVWLTSAFWFLSTFGIKR
jgi:hypothetical protein